MNKTHRIRLNSTSDIVSARLQARDLAIQLGFSGLDVTLITAAISTVARFVVQQNRGGEVLLEEVTQGERSGLRITALAEAAVTGEPATTAVAAAPPQPNTDPDVANLQALMHEMKVVSDTSGDTTIIMKRWK